MASNPIRSKRFPPPPKLPHQLWGPSSLLFNRWRWHFACGRGLKSEVFRSSPSIAEVRNKWNYTSTPPIRLNRVERGNFVCFWRDSPQWARASSFTRFLDHTQRRATFGRTPLDEWSARRRVLYMTTHNTHNRQTSMPTGRIWTHNLNRRAAADLRRRPCGHWDRPGATLLSLIWISDFHFLAVISTASETLLFHANPFKLVTSTKS
jgi:hypothetical protein